MSSESTTDPSSSTEERGGTVQDPNVALVEAWTHQGLPPLQPPPSVLPPRPPEIFGNPISVPPSLVGTWNRISFPSSTTTTTTAPSFFLPNPSSSGTSMMQQNDFLTSTPRTMTSIQNPIIMNPTSSSSIHDIVSPSIITNISSSVLPTYTVDSQLTMNPSLSYTEVPTTTTTTTATTTTTTAATKAGKAKSTPNSHNKKDSSKIPHGSRNTTIKSKRGRGRGGRGGGSSSSATHHRKSGGSNSNTTKHSDPHQSSSRGHGNNSNSRKNQSSGRAGVGPSVYITSDEFPERIVNPLLELPREESVHGSELLSLTDIVFAPPDTYPLSYLGRLLGFHIPSSEGRVFPTEMKVKELSFLDRTKDPFFHIPQLGRKFRPTIDTNTKTTTTTTTTTTTKTGRRCHGRGDYDDQCMLDYIDPVYDHFLTRGFDKSASRSGSPSLLSRLTASNIKAGQTTRISILEDMKNWLLPPPNLEDWNFIDWTTTTTAAATDSVGGGSGSAAAVQWQLEDDDPRMYTVPPPYSFGIIAEYLGRPLYMLHYRFQWYPIQETRESELVMILEGIVKRSSVTPTRQVETISTQSNEMNTADPTIDEQGLAGQTDSEVPLQPSQPTDPQTQEKETPPADETLSDVALPASVYWMMLTSVMENARTAGVWYCLWDAPPEMVPMNEHCFRMTKLPNTSSSSTIIPMICDMKKCSWKYAALQYQQGIPKEGEASSESDFRNEVANRRVLVRLPLEEDVKSIFDPSFATTHRKKRSSTSNADSMDFTNATGLTRDLVVGVRAELSGNDSVRFRSLTSNGDDEDDLVLLKSSVAMGQRGPDMEILRHFPLPYNDEGPVDYSEDEILRELKQKQDLLLKSETDLEPRIRTLMESVISERIAYERPEARAKRAEDLRLLKEHDELLIRRKELDLAEQEQRELDMNAVCSICHDGEVTPDNQILFCEACDVPVHQFCYGVEEIPQGDYYCIPCRHFGRDTMSKEQERTSSTGTRIALPPVPINCELCPLTKGAFVRSETTRSTPDSQSDVSKWVHMACAKWQGLNFIVPDKADLVEDVTELKKYFRRLDIECDICKGKRGAYHQCRFPGCEKYLHLSCARASGICEVIHGEDVEGPVETNPWTLMCAEHSNIDPSDIPEDAMSVEQLIELAKAIPNDPMPEPPPPPRKPFNKMNGKERAVALRDPDYETQFLDEILKKRFAGNRCEVCFTQEHDGNNLARCSDCLSVICSACRLTEKGEVNPDQKNFKCASCRFVREKRKANEEYRTPECLMCNQKTGLLLKSFANSNKMTMWKNNPEEYQRTYFAREIWSHYTCAYWHMPFGLRIEGCQVNLSNVIMSNGRGLIKARQVCHLCGLPNGLKAHCDDSNCRANGEKRSPYRFHITCAREVGYEVDEKEASFFVKCYFHGSCEYNLRARLEDFIEVEKRRAGKNLSKSEAPMSFSDGSRLLYQAMVVMRMLGWAWRWAEHWVEWGSNWEPLLEEGQKEEKMTKKQLKIIDSTPETRADDARRCRLAAFGAALRNRSYDTENGFDDESLSRALTAVLSTESLVGPLNQQEISLSVEWLSRAYRSKSRLLGYGEDKIAVATNGFCVHQADKTPKYELGDRPLPGKVPLEPDQIFENKVEEPDDFLLPELSADGTKCSLPPNSLREVKRKAFKFRDVNPGEPHQSDVDESETHVQPKKEKKTLKKPAVVVDIPSKRKFGRPRNDDQSKVPTRAEFVAAMVPSAVKKRGIVRPERGGSYPLDQVKSKSVVEEPSTTSRSTKKRSFPVEPVMRKPSIKARIVYQDILDSGNSDSIFLRRGRRGRPPESLEFRISVSLDGENFFSQDDFVGDFEYSPEMASETLQEIDQIDGQEIVQDMLQQVDLEAIQGNAPVPVQEGEENNVEETVDDVVGESPEDITKQPIQDEVLETVQGVAEKSTKDNLVEEKSTEADMVQEKPSEDDLVQEKPAGDDVVQEGPNDDDIVPGNPAVGEIVQEKPSDDDVVRENPTKNDIVQENHTEDDIVQENPSQDDVVQENPAEDDIVQGKPSEDDTVKEKPADSDILREQRAENNVAPEKPVENNTIPENQDVARGKIDEGIPQPVAEVLKVSQEEPRGEPENVVLLVQEDVRETIQDVPLESPNDAVLASAEDPLAEPATNTLRSDDTADTVESAIPDSAKRFEAIVDEEHAVESGSIELSIPAFDAAASSVSEQSSKQLVESRGFGRFPGRIRRNTDHFIVSSFKTKPHDIDDSPPQKRRKTSEAATSEPSTATRPIRRTQRMNVSRDEQAVESPLPTKKSPLQTKKSPSQAKKRKVGAAKGQGSDSTPQSVKRTRPNSKKNQEEEEEEWLPEPPMKGRDRYPKRGRRAKEKVADEYVPEEVEPSVTEELPLRAEVYFVRGKRRNDNPLPGSPSFPSPSTRRLRRSARSPGRLLIDESDS